MRFLVLGPLEVAEPGRHGIPDRGFEGADPSGRRTWPSGISLLGAARSTGATTPGPSRKTSHPSAGRPRPGATRPVRFGRTGPPDRHASGRPGVAAMRTTG